MPKGAKCKEVPEQVGFLPIFATKVGAHAFKTLPELLPGRACDKRLSPRDTPRFTLARHNLGKKKKKKKNEKGKKGKTTCTLR